MKKNEKYNLRLQQKPTSSHSYVSEQKSPEGLATICPLKEMPQNEKLWPL